MRSGILFIWCTLLFAFRCTVPLDGGGGETTNGYVTGALVFENGSPASNATVALIDSSYNPAKDEKIPETHIDTTDAGGNYLIRTSTHGIFNVEAVHRSSGKRMLIKSIPVNNDIIHVPLDTLRNPGMLRVLLAESQQAGNGYLYFSGTTYHATIASPADTILIDSLPVGKAPDLYLVLEIAAPRLLARGAPITSDGVTVLESGILKSLFTAIDNEGRFDFIIWCAIDDAGAIWAGTDGGGLFMFDGANTWKHYDFSGRTIFCHKIDHRGKHWIGSDNGLYFFNGMEFTPAIVVAGDTIRDEVHAIFVDDANTKWIVTPLAIFKGDSTAWQSCDYGMTGYSDLLVDKSGVVWIGTSAGGLIADYGTNRQTYTPGNSSLPSGIVTFLALDSAGAVLAGTAAGLAKISGGNWSVFTKANGTLEHYSITKGVVAPSGALWFAGDAMTAVNFQDTKTYPANFLWGKYVTIEAIQAEPSGALWLGSYGGGLVRIKNAL